jgi:hypothetical protein
MRKVKKEVTFRAGRPSGTALVDYAKLFDGNTYEVTEKELQGRTVEVARVAIRQAASRAGLGLRTVLIDGVLYVKAEKKPTRREPA